MYKGCRRSSRLRKKSAPYVPWEGHDFSRAAKVLSFVIPNGLSAREESAFLTFSATCWGQSASASQSLTKCRSQNVECGSEHKFVTSAF